MKLLPPGAAERIAVREEGRFRGRLIVLSSGRAALVKLVTEPGGDSGPAKPLRIDYPVEILLDTLLLNRDPGGDTAVELARQTGYP